MLAACTYSMFPCFSLVSRVGNISSGIGPCFPLAGGLYKFYANSGGKQPIQRQPLLVHYKQQANPLLPTQNYTSLVVTGNDKAKSISLDSPFKPLNSSTPVLITCVVKAEWGYLPRSNIFPSSSQYGFSNGCRLNAQWSNGSRLKSTYHREKNFIYDYKT